MHSDSSIVLPDLLCYYVERMSHQQYQKYFIQKKQYQKYQNCQNIFRSYYKERKNIIQKWYF